MKPSVDEILARLDGDAPPATDVFTYLTILEKSLTHEVLPSLPRFLAERPALTWDMGWDIVTILFAWATMRKTVPGCDDGGGDEDPGEDADDDDDDDDAEFPGGVDINTLSDETLHRTKQAARECMMIVARMGNPREVALRIAEMAESLSPQGDDRPRETLAHTRRHGWPATETTTSEGHDDDDDDDDDLVYFPFSVDDEGYVLLCDMLAVVYPRFRAQNAALWCETILGPALRAYAPSLARTVGIMRLLRAVGQLRPAVPMKLPFSLSTPRLPADLENLVQAAQEGRAAEREANDEQEKKTLLPLQQYVLLFTLRSFLAGNRLDWVRQLWAKYHPPQRVLRPDDLCPASDEGHEEEEAEQKLVHSLTGQLAAMAVDLNILALVVDATTSTDRDEHASRSSRKPSSVMPVFPEAPTLPVTVLSLLVAYFLMAMEVYGSRYPQIVAALNATQEPPSHACSITRVLSILVATSRAIREMDSVDQQVGEAFVVLALYWQRHHQWRGGDEGKDEAREEGEEGKKEEGNKEEGKKEEEGGSGNEMDRPLMSILEGRGPWLDSVFASAVDVAVQHQSVHVRNAATRVVHDLVALRHVATAQDYDGRLLVRVLQGVTGDEARVPFHGQALAILGEFLRDVVHGASLPAVTSGRDGDAAAAADSTARASLAGRAIVWATSEFFPDELSVSRLRESTYWTAPDDYFNHLVSFGLLVFGFRDGGSGSTASSSSSSSSSVSETLAEMVPAGDWKEACRRAQEFYGRLRTACRAIEEAEPVDHPAWAMKRTRAALVGSRMENLRVLE